MAFFRHNFSLLESICSSPRNSSFLAWEFRLPLKRNLKYFFAELLRLNSKIPALTFKARGRIMDMDKPAGTPIHFCDPVITKSMSHSVARHSSPAEAQTPSTIIRASG